MPPSIAVQQQVAPNDMSTANAVKGQNGTSGAVTRGAVTPCSCRGIFWITAGLSWIVWVFAVAAAGDDRWIEGIEGTGIGVGTELMEESCSSAYANESVCIAYESFVASQILATILCSVAVILLTVACFRPYEAAHGSVQVLGLVGGVFMVLYAFFQMAAFLFLKKMKHEYDEYVVDWSFFPIMSSESDELSLGPTYGVGVTAFLFGLLSAIVMLVLYRQAGDGPLLPVSKGAAAGMTRRPQPASEQH